MARRYRRTKSRLARTQSKRFMRQAVGMIAIAFLILVVVIRFGIPLLIRVAVFFTELGGGEIDTVVDRQSIIVPPVLQSQPEATFSSRLDIGGFAPNGSIVRLYINGIEQDDAKASDDGEFEFSQVKLRVGTSRVWATAEDESGTVSDESIEIKILVDNDPPQITLDSLQDSQEVSEKQLTVGGLIDEEASISVNGSFTLQASDNSFSKVITLGEGENTISITATDSAGNFATRDVSVTFSE